MTHESYALQAKPTMLPVVEHENRRQQPAPAGRCISPFQEVILSLAGFVLALCFCFSVVPTGHAASPFPQTIEIPSSPNPVGSGARALGMGGAFIAVADDATAASWNPGGLIQLETPEISAVSEAFYRVEDNTFGTNPEASGKQGVSRAGLNYLSAAYPFAIQEWNMIVSLNYQHLYDVTRQWDLSSGTLQRNAHVDIQQTGGLYALGLAYSIQLLPDLSFGFTANLWDDGIYENGWQSETRFKGWEKDPTGAKHHLEYSIQERYSFSGYNANVGLLWSVTEKLTAGCVFKSPFSADLRHTYIYHLKLQGAPPINDVTISDETMDMPMSYGIGLAYRFSDQWTVSGDVYRTEWEDFVVTRADGSKISPITGLPPGASHIGATNQARLGSEYLIIKPKYTIPLRCGVFYDPAPAEHKSDDFFGFSLGTGIGIGRFIFDIAYQYRFGEDVRIKSLSGMKHSEDLGEQTVYSSLIIHF